MPAITTDAKREIVEDFAKLIRQKKTSGAKPAHTVINFRNEKKDGVERPIEQVPIGLLRYRKDNGRIASDVLDYQKSCGPLDEKTTEAQTILEGFLEEKDPEKTEILTKSIAHSGQNEPAIVTCDGFIINGNRRKMVMEKLGKKDRGRPEFEFMKVVILPGPGDPGGPPALREIEQLENRYQLQSEGKSEYYGFDRALSIKRKMELGFTLEEQLRDDPRYVRGSEKEIDQAVRDVEKDYLLPLERVDGYLQLFGRDGLYSTVSAGRADPEGRWQAFTDYSSYTYQRCFKNPNWLLTSGVDEEDIGGLEDAAFKLIRLRHFKGLPKLHMIMRQFPKLCAVKESRKELLKISEEVDAVLPSKERFDDKGNPLSAEQNDRKWVERYQQDVIHRLKRALDYQESNQEKETPITLLDAAYRKLTHERMKVPSISVSDFAKARQLASDIQKRARDIENEIYHYKKQCESLANKK
ncbi:MAG: hypothetical protein ABSF95_00200 [Verrucomicrobiota bacterium]|jgi:hypothetical protein